MTLTTTFVSLFFLTAGVAIVAVLALVGVNGALRRAHAGFHGLETLLAHVFGETTHPSEEAARGIFALFLSCWAATIGFFIARITNAIPAGVIGIALYALTLILLAGFIAFPLLGYGAFGRKHHPRAPVWIVILALVFSVVLGLCTALLF